jgi:hypothetical protein
MSDKEKLKTYVVTLNYSVEVQVDATNEEHAVYEAERYFERDDLVLQHSTTTEI